MKKNTGRKPESFIKQPNYPGGKTAMDAFIKSTMRYPEAALENKIEGTVAVDLDIDVFGDVTDAKVRHKLGYGCDEEAIRIVKLLKFEKRRYSGLHVVFHRTLNIHFKLHHASKPPAREETLKFNYILKPESSSSGKDKSRGETYNMNIGLD